MLSVTEKYYFRFISTTRKDDELQGVSNGRMPCRSTYEEGYTLDILSRSTMSPLCVCLYIIYYLALHCGTEQYDQHTSGYTTPLYSYRTVPLRTPFSHHPVTLHLAAAAAAGSKSHLMSASSVYNFIFIRVLFITYFFT